MVHNCDNAVICGLGGMLTDYVRYAAHVCSITAGLISYE